MYRLLGEIILILSVVSVMLASVALAASRISLNRNVWLAGFFVEVLDFFYFPLKFFFFKLSDTRKLDKWMVSLKNIAHRNKFANTRARMIIAPHCMRFIECPASSTKAGIQCISCGKCVFTRLKEDAVRFGYKLYIVTGSSFVKHIIKEGKYDGALLIACDYELNKVMMGLKGKDIVTYGIPMLNDGCFNTKVEYSKVIETLEMFADN
ncbi:DUF116 domain-containing protein [Methanolobus halotolerans]|uniref:Polyprenyl synthetase n=1 Tax=Methanolobus halotolerans TaxID=2052935 RepID=A0A4E0R220_9EURY|nr:DUF116 domain-containing protein [Methanolobus halotolerans]TGC11403.1 polyprenyl synthetase [Methanolobus halotolerans]